MDETQNPFQNKCCRAILTLMLLVTSAAATPFTVMAGGDDRVGGEDPTRSAAVQQVIAQGSDLESRGQWSDALILYQDALKVTPHDRQLQQRRSLARLHYDLEKRQSDRSFLAQVESTSGTTAQSLYGEILLKIQSYHVDDPDWNEIARFGLTSLKLAIQTPEFRQRYLANATDQQIELAFADLTQSLNRYVVRQRSDAVWVAGHCAEHLQKTLSLPTSPVIFEFVCGAVSALDPYSAFMSDNQYGETMSQIEGNFVGLGVELRTENDMLEIVNVIAGGPAEQAGILSGDTIVAVDSKLLTEIGSDVAADMLRGVEGSTVAVTLVRDSRHYQANVTRRRVDIPSVDNIRMVDQAGGVGYLRISSFQKTTARDFDEALWQLQRSGMRSLVMDLRGNPGGLLTAAVEIADRFVASGVLVSTRGRNPLEDFTHRAHNRGTWNVPLVVLIDHDSASASEILAAAIRDHKRGQIVGEKSYGKGSVQGIFPLNISGGGIRLTTAKFYSPTGSEINQIGVSPDVEIHQTAKIPADGTLSDSDNVLQSAIALARTHTTPQNLSPKSVAGR